MLILFDNGTPRGLARLLAAHSVEEARSRGWEELGNGELIDAAEQAGFKVIVTTDKNIPITVDPFSSSNEVKKPAANRVYHNKTGISRETFGPRG
jgi:predicted nuclease of predicted toxin-antitoxin system